MRVAIVDDTPDLRLLLRMALEHEDGIDVVAEGANGREGIDIAAQHHPDVMLLDLAMPVMDGLTALPQIHEHSPGTAVVVLSGFAADVMTERAVAAGARRYLQKGASPEELRRAVLDVAGVPRQTRYEHRSSSGPTGVRAGGDGGRVDTEDEVARLRQAIATTAHEIRNPVTVLTGVAGVLEDDRVLLDDGRRRQVVAALRRQGGVLERMTDDLLTAAQVDRGTLRLEVRDTPLEPVVRGAVADVADVTDNEIAVTGDLHAQVHADPTRLGQMLVNLLTNATKYGEPPYSVAVGRTTPGMVTVSVRDHGAGVPESFRHRLFDEFARAEGVAGRGTGLGLYVVRTLAQAQGGEVHYRPGPTGGSVFDLTLREAGAPTVQTGRPDSV